MAGNYIAIQRQPLGRLNHESSSIVVTFIKLSSSLASFQKHDEGIHSEIEVDDRLWTGNASYVKRLFQNGDDNPLLSDQPPLSSHLLILRG